MTKKLELFKKKLLYRASYRGTKEMDILLSSFVKKHVNLFTESQLIGLEKFLNFEDETILNYCYLLTLIVINSANYSLERWLSG